MSRPSDLVQGTLDLLILKILALEPMHGWAISQRLKQMSGDVLQVSDGSLYPGAAQARAAGLDRSRVEADREQPPRQVLCADPVRQETARAETESWARLAGAISSVVALPEV